MDAELVPPKVLLASERDFLSRRHKKLIYKYPGYLLKTTNLTLQAIFVVSYQPNLETA